MDREPLTELTVRLPSQLASYLRREARAAGVSVDVYLTRTLQGSYQQRMLELLRASGINNEPADGTEPPADA